jgi:hypothetical protein
MRSIGLFFVLVVGCATAARSSTFVPTNASPRPLWSKSPSEVAVVSTPPARAFVEIGLVESWPSGYWEEGPQGVLDKMRADAGRYGCDALLITGVNQSDPPDIGRPRMGYHGACLVYPDAVPPAPTAPVAAAPPAPKPSEPPALLFRNTEGNVYRVRPEARDQALHAGWVQIGTD